MAKASAQIRINHPPCIPFAPPRRTLRVVPLIGWALTIVAPLGNNALASLLHSSQVAAQLRVKGTGW